MNTTKTLVLAAAASAMVVGSSHAGVLASTDFDSSKIGTSTNIKTHLAWTLDGLVDPGDMVAKNAVGGNQSIFDGTTLTQDNFTPGLNTGNGNTFWTTELSITVAAGFTVTLEDVSFNSVSVSGGQALNAARRNDFTVTLLNPSGDLIEAVTIADTNSGNPVTQPLITFDFADVVLNLPGTYTLEIKGGDFTGTNETGNHTGIDNLSINGTAVPEPSSLALIGLGGLLIARRRRG